MRCLASVCESIRQHVSLGLGKSASPSIRRPFAPTTEFPWGRLVPRTCVCRRRRVLSGHCCSDRLPAPSSWLAQVGGHVISIRMDDFYLLYTSPSPRDG